MKPGGAGGAAKRITQPDIMHVLDSLEVLLQQAGSALSVYIGRGFLIRFISASSDQDKFQGLHTKDSDCMGVGGVGACVGGGWLGPGQVPGAAYQDQRLHGGGLGGGIGASLWVCVGWIGE